MARLHSVIIAAMIALFPLFAGASAQARAPDLPFAGACELVKAGKFSYRGTCAILRTKVTAEDTGGRCAGEVITVQIPGRGEANLLRGVGQDCTSQFLDSPVTFIGEDSEGWLVVSTEAGKVLRFEPGPEPGLPVLDAFLAGMDSCTPSEALKTFFENLSDSYATPSDAPDGPVAATETPVIWPPGGLLAPELVAAQKLGPRMRIDVALQGNYLGLPVSRLQYDYRPEGGGFLEQSLVFESPRAEVVARFGAAIDQAERMLRAETGDRNRAYIAEGEPGRLVCVFPE